MVSRNYLFCGISSHSFPNMPSTFAQLFSFPGNWPGGNEYMILRSFLSFFLFFFVSLIPVGFCQGVGRAAAGQREVGQETVATARASSRHSSFQAPVTHLSSCVVLTKPPYSLTHVPHHHENLLSCLTFVHAPSISLTPSSRLTSIYWWDPHIHNSLLWWNTHSIRLIISAILSIQFSSIR